MLPEFAKATKIPVVADELCNIAVIVNPTNTPKKLFFPITEIKSLNICKFDIGLREDDINPIPINNIPNPKAI